MEAAVNKFIRANPNDMKVRRKITFFMSFNKYGLQKDIAIINLIWQIFNTAKILTLLSQSGILGFLVKY